MDGDYLVFERVLHFVIGSSLLRTNPTHQNLIMAHFYFALVVTTTIEATTNSIKRD